MIEVAPVNKKKVRNKCWLGNQNIYWRIEIKEIMQIIFDFLLVAEE